MQKIYNDPKQQKEIVDVSGTKTLAEINAEFDGDFVDVTEDRHRAIAKEKQDADARKQVKEQHKASAKVKLKALGLTDEEVDALTK